MGKFCVEVMIDNGERLCDFCGMNEPDVLVNGCMITDDHQETLSILTNSATFFCIKNLKLQLSSFYLIAESR